MSKIFSLDYRVKRPGKKSWRSKQDRLPPAAICRGGKLEITEEYVESLELSEGYPAGSVDDHFLKRMVFDLIKQHTDSCHCRHGGETITVNEAIR